MKLHAAGVYLGNEGEALSNSTITRQQAVAMIGRAFRIAPETVSLSYEDAAQVAEYAAPYVSEFTARGYITDSANGPLPGRQSLSPGRKSSTSLETWSIRW